MTQFSQILSGKQEAPRRDTQRVSVTLGDVFTESENTHRWTRLDGVGIVPHRKRDGSHDSLPSPTSHIDFFLPKLPESRKT